MRPLQSLLPYPQAKTRYEWHLLPGSPPREDEILILGGKLGVGEHVRLSG